MNPDLARLQPYPFQRLARLLDGVEPPADLPPIALSIGEPRQPAPGFIGEALVASLPGLSNYPLTRGSEELREAIAGWLVRRFGLPLGSIDPGRHLLPVNGTREALFAFAQCVVDRSSAPLVAMPNPFYQIYEGATLLAGAEPYFLNCTAANGFLPDYNAVPTAVWERCQLLYLCSPANPSGAVTDEKTLVRLIELAERYDFVIAADECYSELYDDEDSPPPGLLGACARLGNTGYRRCIVFHSLSKRSSVPGLRSGFIAGDAAIVDRFHLYRTYHGCAMAPPTQAASAAAWRDEEHVAANRTLYRERFDAVVDILAPVVDLSRPPAGFYLWARTPTGGERFARELLRAGNVTVLPGSYLARTVEGIDPGADRVRIALVAPIDECIEAARRIRRHVETAA